MHDAVRGSMKMIDYCDTAPCSLIGRPTFHWYVFSSSGRRWRQYAPLKRLSTSTDYMALCSRRLTSSRCSSLPFLQRFGRTYRLLVQGEETQPTYYTAQQRAIVSLHIHMNTSNNTTLPLVYFFY
jgi:hypothetical protein